MDKWDICQLWLDDIGREGQLATTSGKITGVQNSKREIASPLCGAWTMLRMLVDTRKT